MRVSDTAAGKEDERFAGGEIDSLEQKLLNKKNKSDEQLLEIKGKVGNKEESIPTLNPFAKKE